MALGYVNEADVQAATFRGGPTISAEWGSVKHWVFDLPADVSQDFH